MDKEGIVQNATINNLACGRSIGETIRTLMAIQNTQIHENEVCPVDWQEGMATITIFS